jgi:hypothetical protein
MTSETPPAATDEIIAFKAALDAAGQPWARIGVRTVGAGFIGCLLTLIVSQYVIALYAVRGILFGGSLAVIAVGWVFLIMAMLKRRAWGKAQALHEPPLSGSGLNGSGPGLPGAQ